MQPSQTLPRTDFSTLRLLYPQWQGGDVASWFKDLSPKEAAQGYVLGAQILNLLVDSIAPSANTAVVNIEKDFMLDSAGQRVAQEGIIDKAPLLRQTKAAFEILKTRKPAKILTLGGECAVSVPSFCYLASLYDDVALVWLDAHPDIGLPNDDFYQGYHAMAVSAIIGQGGLQETFGLPSWLESSKVLLVGLHSDEAKHYAPRQKEFGLASLAPNDVAKDSSKILGWLAKSGAKRVMIHLDLDVLDARELYVAVGNTGQMSLEQVMRIINDIAAQYEVVGLTIAEHLSKAHIKLRRLLENLPLVKE
ncbi:arginase family protein [Helicobacter sp. MIT 05-5293]|uniref:arginase family protein n=1 Tax=Helicobacter sp. MIT 05-5293 TaxID=1548149 RepID=UPI0010FF19FF|nr:arginase family protein [Helicobacter sp. MIT 05-5293]TLD80895.1 arginase family protein [Helicobacter sp. MIT 05-5293]